jgi:hypothetical protein
MIIELYPIYNVRILINYYDYPPENCASSLVDKCDSGSIMPFGEVVIVE